MSPVESNGWDALGARAEQRASAAVRYAATNAVTHARMRSRVKTGAMRDAWRAGFEMGGLKATVYDGQNYAIFHEQGFHDRGGGWVAPQPMLGPAFEAVAGTFYLMLAQVFEP